MSECVINHCNRPQRTRGLCKPHYTRYRRQLKKGLLGENSPPTKPMRSSPQPGRICSREFCNEPYLAKGLCRRHYDLERYEANKQAQATT